MAERERSFVDSRGVRWRVYERWIQVSRVSPPILCLVFDSGHLMRHAREFPFDWDTLDAPALETLSWML